MKDKPVIRLRGVAYCHMCTFSLSESHDPVFIAEGSIQSLKDLATQLENEDGEIPTTPGDYSQRQGLIRSPLTSAEVTHVLPVLHAKLQTFNWITQRFLVGLNSHKKWHSVFQPIRYSTQEKKKEEDAYKFLQAEVKQQLGLDIGSAGDMDTGNKFHRFSTDAAREVLANLITDESAREPFKEIHLHLCAIV